MKVKTMSKKIWIIIIIVIILGIICGITLNKKDVETTNTPNIIKENELKNEEIINNEENNVIENEENIEVTESDLTTNTSTESFTENPKTAEEKAIEIVKKDYGTEENTSFAVEGMDQSGRYIVAVRNSDTTEALAFYFVDMSNGTFTKK
jgi:uncharacterized protein YxeA